MGKDCRGGNFLAMKGREGVVPRGCCPKAGLGEMLERVQRLGGKEPRRECMGCGELAAETQEQLWALAGAFTTDEGRTTSWVGECEKLGAKI